MSEWPRWTHVLEGFPKECGCYWVLLRCPQTKAIVYKTSYFDGEKFILPVQHSKCLIGWTDKQWEPSND